MPINHCRCPVHGSMLSSSPRTYRQGTGAPTEPVNRELLSCLTFLASLAILSKPDTNEGKSHQFVPLSSIFCLISLNY